MARATFENNGWIPEESSSVVIQKVARTSAVEAYARPEVMTTDVKNVPRSAGFAVSAVAKGAAYGEDTSTNDSVTLTARKIGGVLRIAEEDIEDAKNVDIVNAKKLEWAASYATYLDNAALAVNAAENGGTVPFTSVYKSLTTTDSGLGYTANDNRVVTAGTGAAPTYDQLSNVLGKVEGGAYFDASRVVVIASPAFRGALRGIKDTAGNPIFVQGLAGTPDTLFGAPIVWSSGARVTTSASAAPAGAGGVAGTAGNPLLVVANADYLVLGKRSDPESVLIDGRDGASALTDETLLKMRARRGFALAHPAAAAVLEWIA